MATEGKIPLLGFKAAAIKFVTLLGFSQGEAAVVVPADAGIPMTGSLTPAPALTGSLAAAMTGSLATTAMTGSQGD